MQKTHAFLTTDVKASLDTFLGILVFHSDAEQRFFDLLKIECINDSTDKKTARAFYQKEMKRRGLISVVHERFLEPYRTLETMLLTYHQKQNIDLTTFIHDIVAHHIIRCPPIQFFYFFSDKTPQGMRKLQHAYVDLVEKYLCLLPYVKESQKSLNTLGSMKGYA